MFFCIVVKILKTKKKILLKKKKKKLLFNLTFCPVVKIEKSLEIFKKTEL